MTHKRPVKENFPFNTFLNSQNKHHSQSSVLHYQGKLSCSTETEEYILMKTTENLLKVQQATIRNVRIVADLHRSRWFAMLTYFISVMRFAKKSQFISMLAFCSFKDLFYFSYHLFWWFTWRILCDILCRIFIK